MNVELIRTIDNGVQTTGKWYVTDGAHFACDTLERTYADNKRGVSCIPPGKYHCAKVGASQAIPYEHISITAVPGRSGICIHKGNHYFHSRGCVLVGKGYSDINKDGEIDILNSKNTFDALMKIVPQNFILTITEAQKKPTIKPLTT